MVKRKSISFFGLLMLVYFLVRWFEIFGTTGILRWYLTDLLFVPAMCTFALIWTRWIKRNRNLTIPTRNIFIQVVIVSAYFEWYLPFHDPKYTSDPWDVVMYFIGGLIFLFVQKRL